MGVEQENQIRLARTGYSFNTITLPADGAGGLESYLLQHIAPHAEAYLNTPLVIDISMVNHLIDLDYPQLVNTCRKYGLNLLGLSGAITEERVKVLVARGIPVVNSSRFTRMREENFKPRVITQTFEVQVPVKVPVPVEVKVPVEVRKGEPMHVITRNLRAGELVSVADNSVAVFGNVQRGARVMASHNVFIFGDLKGEVFAGSPKDNQDPGFDRAFIYIGGAFEPTVVAIAGNYQTADDMDHNPELQELAAHKQELLVMLQDRTLHYSPVTDFIK